MKLMRVKYNIFQIMPYNKYSTNTRNLTKWIQRIGCNLLFFYLFSLVRCVSSFTFCFDFLSVFLSLVLSLNDYGDRMVNFSSYWKSPNSISTERCVAFWMWEKWEKDEKSQSGQYTNQFFSSIRLKKITATTTN